ncbi:MAG: ThiF family adenylyltransferase [Pirellulaceae bacterium]
MRQPVPKPCRMSDEPFILDENDRYSRFRLIAWWDQNTLATARIMVVGAGALGNEVLKNLALMGIGEIHLIDFDHIEESNLTRAVLFRQRDCGRSKAEAAADSLRDMNPDVRVHPRVANVVTQIGLGLFRDVDVVIGCLDNREARLWVNRSCWRVGTPWIDGGIQEINGVVKVFVPPDGPCYECGMTENDYRLINLRYSCPLLRQEDIQSGKVPTSPTIAAMVGGLQTQEALKLLHGLPVESGAALIYNGMANTFYTTRFQRCEECLSHESYPEPLALPLGAASHSAAELLQAVCQLRRFPVASSRIELDRDLVTSIECEPCGTSRMVMRAREEVGHRETICENCGQVARPRIEHEVNAGSPLAKAKLVELGIPPYDIVRIVSGTAEQLVLLAGDAPAGAPPTVGGGAGS